MDMSNHPTALILWQFYGTLLKELVVLLIVLGGIFWWRRHHKSDNKAPANGEPPILARQILYWGFGGLWVLAGLLQAQPAMSTEFAPHYLVPNLNGQPFWLFNLMEFGVVLWARHPIFWDTAAVWLQLGIGIAMIWGQEKRVGRIALWVAVVWALWVWVMGEGIGGLLVPGENSWLAGAPGASLLYAVAACILLVPVREFTVPRVRRGIARGFTLLWGLLLLTQLWPPDGYWTGRLLASATLSMAHMPQPSWISAPVYATADLMAKYPDFINALVVAILAMLTIWWAIRPGRAVAWVTACWVVLTWALCQDYGVLGGLATDPNTGLPVLIFIAAFLSLSTGNGDKLGQNAFGAHGRDRILD